MTRNGSSTRWRGRWARLDTLAAPALVLAIGDGSTLSLEALLGRSTVDVGDGEFADYLDGAAVLVTGAGGSIGAELCARLTRLGVRELVLVDQAEAPLLELAATLRHDHGFAGAVPVLADIRSAARAVEVFERYRPGVVFHAAAYKHVPLLEAHPVEAVATNVLGTRSVVAAARRVGVERLVSFSTDKAVQPTNILGQTKAVAEWIVAAAGHPRYTSIRLGNVVDSAGSILPLFRRQVARGGPVTVTHPQATRYLMTGGEAAGLAIAAGALADSGGIFWLDVGPPVRVLDVARRLAGGAPREVTIDFVGLRAGERLHERLFRSGDKIAATACGRVFRSTLPAVDPAWLNGWIAALARQVDRASAVGVRTALAEMHGAPEPEVVQPGAVVAR
jgi:FlaA1/EpsC-like NDP-sugar epimerase